VLDVGAGPGYASFLLAERLRGGGAVYATDIRQDFVDYIAQEAERRGLDNLTAAVVSETGLDGFYLRHRYDLVLLSNVYHCLDGRVAYFSELRGTLAPGARLVLILYNQAPLLTPEDFLQLDDLARALRAEEPASPFAAGLSDTTRAMLDEPGTAGLREPLARDFNRMLTDPLFHRAFARDSYFLKDLLSPTERDFANWLIMTLTETGAFERPGGELDERTMRAVITLNRIFLVNRFGGFLAQGGRGLYLPAGDANRQTSKYTVLRELDAAGYRLVSETRLSPYYDAVVMAPKAP
jgi:SAM-dependent methyltransferase